MLVASIGDSALTARTTLEEACALVWSHPQVLSELLELVDVLDERVSHLQHDRLHTPTSRCACTDATRASKSSQHSVSAQTPA